MVKLRTKPYRLYSLSLLLGLAIVTSAVLSHHVYSRFFQGQSLNYTALVLAYNHTQELFVKNQNATNENKNSSIDLVEVASLRNELKAIQISFDSRVLQTHYKRLIANEKTFKRHLNDSRLNFSFDQRELALLNEWKKSSHKANREEVEQVAYKSENANSVKIVAPRWSKELSDFSFADGENLNEFLGKQQEEKESYVTVSNKSVLAKISNETVTDEVNLIDAKSLVVPEAQIPQIDLPKNEANFADDSADSLRFSEKSSFDLEAQKFASARAMNTNKKIELERDQFLEELHAEFAVLEKSHINELKNSNAPVQEQFIAKNEYSTPSDPFASASAKVQLPSSVHQTIKRELEKNQIFAVADGKRKPLIDPSLFSAEDDVATVAYGSSGAGSKTGAGIAPLLAQKNFLHQFENKIGSSSKMSSTHVRLFSVVLGQGASKVSGFTFAPYYNSNESYYDNGTGEILIQTLPNDFQSTMSGSFNVRDHLFTTADLVLENGEFSYSVLMLEREGLEKFLNTQKIERIEGGLAFIDLDESTTAVHLETEKGEYSPMFYFDENFQHIASEADRKDARYALFAELPSSNMTLKYTTKDKTELLKIIHITEGEVYFDFNGQTRKAKDVISPFEVTPFGATPLQVEPEKISFFNQTRDPRDMKLDGALNRYELSNVQVPLGSRFYYIFKHLEDTLVVGKGGYKSRVYLPSSQGITAYLNDHKIPSLDPSRCVIQINLGLRKAQKFEFQGRGAKGGLYLDVDYLDQDQVYREEISPDTRRIFIIGEEEGVVDVKVEYTDKSSDTFQTYCSEKTYLVEQL